MAQHLTGGGAALGVVVQHRQHEVRQRGRLPQWHARGERMVQRRCVSQSVRLYQGSSMPDCNCFAANQPCIVLEVWEVLMSLANCSGAGHKAQGTVGLLLRKGVLAHPSPKPVDSITCI